MLSGSMQVQQISVIGFRNRPVQVARLAAPAGTLMTATIKHSTMRKRLIIW